MHRPERVCWACASRWTNGTRDCLTRALQYEAAVEYIESQTGSFTIAGLWDSFSPMYPPYGNYDRRMMHQTFNNAVHDMAMHGLVICVRRGRGGRKCLEWQTISVYNKQLTKL